MHISTCCLTRSSSYSWLRRLNSSTEFWTSLTSSAVEYCSRVSRVIIKFSFILFQTSGFFLCLLIHNAYNLLKIIGRTNLYLQIFTLENLTNRQHLFYYACYIVFLILKEPINRLFTWKRWKLLFVNFPTSLPKGEIIN